MRKFSAFPVVIVLACLSYTGRAVAQTVTASPSSITFQGSPGSTVPPQTIMINGPSGATFTVTASYGSSNPAAWFTVSPVTLTTGQTVTVSLPSTNLPSGTTGSITFLQNGTSNGVTVPVTFTSTGTGNGTLTAMPSSISLNFTGAISQQVVVTINGPSTVTLAASTNSGTGPFGWLTVTQPSGPPPATFTVTVDPANLPAGTTNGSVTVTQGATNFVIIPVSATVPAGTYSYSPNSVNFSVNGFSPTLSDQSLTITGPNNAQVTATASVNNGGYQWLSVNPAGGALTNSTLTLVVTVNPVDLVLSQTFTGDITITQAGSTVLTIPVTVTTGGTPTLTVTPGQFNFAWEAGTAPPPPQIAVATSTGSAPDLSLIATTANCGASWLAVNPATTQTISSAMPVPVTVSINTANLVPSATVGTTTCSGTIQLNAPAAANSTTNLPVNLLVSTQPVIQVLPSSFTINYQPGGPLPGPLVVQVNSSSPQTEQLSFTPTVSPGSTGTNFLIAAQTNPSTPGAVVAELNSTLVAGLALGTYVDNLVISSNAPGNPSINVPVTLNVGTIAALYTTPSQVTINYEIGQKPPAAPAITALSTGVPITFIPSAASGNCNSWLSVSPANTSLSTLTSTGQNGATVNVAFNLAGLTNPNTCAGQLLLNNPGSSTPTVVPVIVNVVNQAVIDLGVNSITETATPGSTIPITVTVPVTSSDNTAAINWSVSAYNLSSQSWLSIPGSTMGSTPGSVALKFDPTGLAPATYNGFITITDNRANSPVPSQGIPVTFTVGNQVTANPSSLTFTQAFGGPAPPSQTVQITTSTSGLSFSTSATTFSGGNWLSVSPGGTAPGTVSVSVNTSGLAAGSYAGSVVITVPGATPNPLYFPVVVNVTGAATLSASPGSLTFSGTVGQSISPQNLTIMSTGGSVPFTAVAASPTTGLITVTPNSGTTPGTVSVSVNSGGLAAGTYNGTVTISSISSSAAALQIPVTINVGATMGLQLMSIDNAASGVAGAVSPGEIVSIFGTNIGPATPANLTLTSAGTVSTMLANTQVFFDGIAAPLIYASATQINAIAPYEIAGRQQTTVTVSFNGATSAGLTLQVVSTAPAVFTTTQNGTGQAAALNQDLTPNSATNPAAPGSVISIYGTGEGQLNPPGVTGTVTPSSPPFPIPIQNVSVSFLVPGPGGTTTSVPATIEYAGEAPGLASGVLQVNVQIPAGVPRGASVPVTLTVGTATSNQATIAIN